MKTTLRNETNKSSQQQTKTRKKRRGGELNEKWRKNLIGRHFILSMHIIVCAHQRDMTIMYIMLTRTHN